MTVKPYDATGNVRDLGGEPRATSRSNSPFCHEVPEHGRGQQFLDQHELLNALRDCGRTLTKIILLQNINVPFVLRTLDLRQLCESHPA
jgi:hypothetical protein